MGFNLAKWLKDKENQAGKAIGNVGNSISRASDTYNPFDRQFQQKAQQYFAPTNQLRTRDVVRELPRAFVKMGKDWNTATRQLPEFGKQVGLGIIKGADSFSAGGQSLLKGITKPIMKPLGIQEPRTAQLQDFRPIQNAMNAPTKLGAVRSGAEMGAKTFPYLITGGGADKAVAPIVSKLAGGGIKNFAARNAIKGAANIVPDVIQSQAIYDPTQGSRASQAAFSVGVGALAPVGGEVVGKGLSNIASFIAKNGKNIPAGLSIKDISKDVPVKGGQIPKTIWDTPLYQDARNKAISDANLQKNMTPKFGVGEKVTTPEGRNFIVKEAYIDNGKVKYGVYTPGKKTSNAHQFSVKESDLLPINKSVPTQLSNPSTQKTTMTIPAKPGSIYDEVIVPNKPITSTVKGGVDIPKPTVAESILGGKTTNAFGKNVDQAKFEASQLADLNKIAPERGASIASPAIPTKKPVVNINSIAQRTTNKVEIPKIDGETIADRVASARANSESIRQQIAQRGQEAYVAGRGIKDNELRAIRDAYQSGKSIDEIANSSSKPGVVKNYLEKLRDYYDFELAADRAVGGTTMKESNHLRQVWDLSDPAKKAQFDELAKQRGISGYSGYGSQPKVFKSYAEGEALGFKPKNRNINEDLLHHSLGASDAISKRNLINGLQEAAPGQVSITGMGRTADGKPFVNSNMRGMEGLSYTQEVEAQLKGYTPLKGAAGPNDFIKNAKIKGAEGARNVGVGQYVDRVTGTIKAIPKAAKEAGFTGVAGALYDHSSQELKKILLNMSFFHVLNVGETNLGRIVTHPIKGSRSMLQAIGSLPSEKVAQANIKYYKGKMIPGTNMSVFDAALASGQNMSRGLPVKGVGRLNVIGGTGRATFDRFIYTLQMGLNDQIFGNGKINPNSTQGRALGREIELAVGKLNQITNNIDPNTMKWFSRGVLAPQYTASKYKMLWDSVSKWGKIGSANMSQGNFSRSTVAGEAFAVGTIATLGTMIATGEFPELNQTLMNYTFDPRIETNMKNTKGENIDIKTPKTFLSEPGGIIVPAVTGNTWEQKTEGLVHAGQSRLNPLLADATKIATNKNYYGENVVPSGMNSVDAAKTMAGDILSGRTPIGAQSILRAIQGKDTPTQAAIGILGARTTTNKNAPSQIYSNVYDLQTAIDDVTKNLTKQKITPEDATKKINELTAKRDEASAKLSGVSSPVNATGGRSYIKADGTPGWAKNEDVYKKAVSTEKQKQLTNDFEKSDKPYEFKNGLVYTRNPDNTAATPVTEAKFAYDIGKEYLQKYKDSDDLEGWMVQAQDQYDNINEQLKNKNLSPIDKITLQNDAQTLINDMAKYKDYGAFTKGKSASVAKQKAIAKTLSLLKADTTPQTTADTYKYLQSLLGSTRKSAKRKVALKKVG